MLDVLFMVGAVGFFVFAAAFAYACDRLMEERRDR